VLRQAERHGEEGMQQAEGGADPGREDHAGPQVAALIHPHPAGHGAGGEDALDAEVQHPGALADQLAQRAEDQWRGDPQRRRPEAGGQQDVEHLAHRHLTR
jgi:hypothetical protein